MRTNGLRAEDFIKQKRQNNIGGGAPIANIHGSTPYIGPLSNQYFSALKDIKVNQNEN